MIFFEEFKFSSMKFATVTARAAERPILFPYFFIFSGNANNSLSSVCPSTIICSISPIRSFVILCIKSSSPSSDISVFPGENKSAPEIICLIVFVLLSVIASGLTLSSINSFIFVSMSISFLLAYALKTIFLVFCCTNVEVSCCALFPSNLLIAKNIIKKHSRTEIISENETKKLAPPRESPEFLLFVSSIASKSCLVFATSFSNSSFSAIIFSAFSFLLIMS